MWADGRTWKTLGHAQIENRLVGWNGSFACAMKPRRLWRRYLNNGAQFIVWIALEFAGLRKRN